VYADFSWQHCMARAYRGSGCLSHTCPRLPHGGPWKEILVRRRGLIYSGKVLSLSRVPPPTHAICCSALAGRLHGLFRCSLSSACPVRTGTNLLTHALASPPPAWPGAERLQVSGSPFWRITRDSDGRAPCQGRAGARTLAAPTPASQVKDTGGGQTPHAFAAKSAPSRARAVERMELARGAGSPVSGRITPPSAHEFGYATRNMCEPHPPDRVGAEAILLAGTRA
jgi:hypothetical protein